MSAINNPGGIGLQSAYLAASSAADNIILLTTAGGTVIIRDNATPINNDLFSIYNAAGTLPFFFVDDYAQIGMTGSYDFRASTVGASNNASVLAGGIGGLNLSNTTAATAGIPVQNSPVIELSGRAWNPTSATNKGVGARLVMQGVSANPTSQNLLITSRGTDGGGYATRMDIGTTDSIMRTLFTLLPPVATSGSPTIFTITGPANTTLTASTEAIDVNFNLARTVQFATGALTTQRAMLVQAPTYGFVAASTLTTAATVAIVGAPAAGTNATITNTFSLWIQNGKSCFDYPDIASVTTTGLLMRNNTGGISSQLPPVIEFAGTLAISESAVAIYGKVGLTGVNSGGASVSYLTFIVREQTGGADVEALRLTASTTTSQVLSTAAKNLSITSDVADSGTNVGVIFNNSTALTGTTLLASFRNNGVEKFAIADDGSLALQGTTTGTYTLGGTPTLNSGASALAINGTAVTITGTSSTVVSLVSGSANVYTDHSTGAFVHYAGAGLKVTSTTVDIQRDAVLTSGKFVTTTSSATVPPAITWTAVTFENNWVNFGAPYYSCGYYKDALGFVHLRGLAKDGTVTTTIFTLPTGYQPSSTHFQSNITNGTVASAILVANTGAVSCNSGGSGSISLDGIVFYAEE